VCGPGKKTNVVFGSEIWENGVAPFQILRIEWFRFMFENKNGTTLIFCLVRGMRALIYNGTV
jgi:hypothetical protein